MYYVSYCSFSEVHLTHKDSSGSEMETEACIYRESNETSMFTNTLDSHCSGTVVTILAFRIRQSHGSDLGKETGYFSSP